MKSESSDRRWVEACLIGAVLLATAVLALHKLSAHDLWWQLRTGELVLTDGWPATDPFSYAYPDREWIELRWLFCSLLWLLFDFGGVDALVLSRVALAVATVGVLLSWPVGPGRRWAAAAGATGALLLLCTRFALRPEILTYLLLAVELQLLERWRIDRRARWLAPLPALQVIWSNSHTLAILGPVVQGCYLAAEILRPGRHPERSNRKALATVAGISTLALLATPYGLRGALFPFRLFGQIKGSHDLASLIDEFRSPLAEAEWGFFSLSWIAIAVVSGACLLLPRSFPIGLASTWAAFFYLSLLAQRNVALFGIVAGIAVTTGLAEAAGRRRWPKRSGIAFVVLSTGLLVPLAASDAFFIATDRAKRFGFGVSPHRFPIRALDFAREQGLPFPVLHGLGDGGYVLFEGGPRSVYVDGRLEVYETEAIADAVAMTRLGRGFDAEAERLGIWTAVVEHARTQNWVSALERHPRWRAVYFDPTHVIYLRLGPETAAPARELGLDWSIAEPFDRPLPPRLASRDRLAGLWPRRADVSARRSIGQLFLQIGDLERGVEELQRAHERAPRDRETLLHLGLARQALGDSEEADRLLAPLPERLLQSEQVLLLEASLLEMADRPREAAGKYRELAGGSTNPTVFRGLARSSLAAEDPASAIEALRRLTALRPAEVDAWNDLGLLWLRGGRLPEALGAFEESVRRRPQQASVWNQLGVIHARSGDLPEARRAFRRALAEQPDHPGARENLARLEALE